MNTATRTSLQRSTTAFARKAKTVRLFLLTAILGFAATNEANAQAAISGPSSVCANSVAALSDATAGGTWTSATTAIATVDQNTGVVSGVTAGTSVISYNTNSGSVTANITVLAAPDAITGGGTAICPGSTMLLSDAAGGGAWSSRNSAIAVVDASGVVTGIDGGTASIYYTVGGCSSSIQVQVQGQRLWTLTGGTAAASNYSYYTSVAVDAGGTPYIAFQDNNNNNRATVRKYNGSNWVTVGSAGFTSSPSGNIKLAIARDGTLYMAYYDQWYGNCYLMKFDGSNWVQVGPYLYTSQFDLAIAPDGTAYIAFSDGNNSNKITLATFDGNNWVTIGDQSLSALYYYYASYPSLAIDGHGQPYIAFKDGNNSSNAVVLTYTGGNWINVGGANVPNTNPASMSLALDGSGKPYIGFYDNNYGSGTVMTFDGVSWLQVGGSYFTNYNISYVSLAVTPSGTPYLSYQEYYYYGGRTNVMTYDGNNWVQAGNDYASPGQSGYVSMVLGSNGDPYVGYTDNSNGQWPTVKQLHNISSVITGANAVYAGSTIALSDASANGQWATSTPAIATISNTGSVTGLTPGASIISYATTFGCTLTKTITVTYNTATPISGTQAVCFGLTSQLSDGAADGTWTSDNMNVALVSGNGLVTGLAAGTANIIYTLVGGSSATTAITVTGSAITGAGGTMCPGTTVMLSNATGGGTWTSSNTAIAIVDASGVVTGIDGGSASISYSLPGGCATTVPVSFTGQQLWTLTGNVAAANTYSTYTSVAADAAGAAYMAFQDNNNGNRATVRKYNGSSWAPVGNVGFTSHPSGNMKIVTASSGTPYMIYYDQQNGNVYVMKFDGNSWGQVGNAVISNTTQFDIAIAVDGTPCVTYIDGNHNSSVRVAKFDGNNWITIGDQSLNNLSYNYASYPSIAIDSHGKMYVAFKDGYYSNNAVVLSYDGSNWTAIGGQRVQNTNPASMSLALDASGNPYIGYMDGNYNSGSVMKFDGTSWSQVGNIGFTHNTISNATLCLSPSGTPYFGYQETYSYHYYYYYNYSYTTNYANVMTYNGNNWVQAGGTYASANQGQNFSMTMGSNGLPWVGYSDINNGQYPTMQQLKSLSSVITGPNSVYAGSTIALSDASPYGQWGTSTPAIAGVSYTGIVSGLIPGTSVVTYATTFGCTLTKSVTVTYNTATPISGTLALCSGSISQLSDGAADGTWASDNVNIATVTSGGLVTGVNAGSANIVYTLVGGSSATAAVTVTGSAITGAGVLCPGATMMLSESAAGGTWTSGNTSIAVVDATGTVTGVTGGTANISYTLPSGCVIRAIVSVPSNADWIVAGTAGFTGSGSNRTSVATAPDGTKYMAYADNYSNRASVYKYSGSSWSLVGPDAFVSNTQNLQIVVGSDGTPYIGYNDNGNNNQPTVMRFDGNNWVMVGSYVVQNYTDNLSLALDRNNVPYAAYRDGNNNYRASVSKFDGSNWVTVGNTSISNSQTNYVSLAIDGNNTPYAVFTDVSNGSYPTLMRFDGSNWVSVGGYVDARNAAYPTVVIAANGTPYVAFADQNYGTYGKVRKFDGTNWMDVGSYINYTSLSNISLAVDANSTPYVAYTPYYYFGQAPGVVKFDGTNWTTSGSAITTQSINGYLPIALDNTGLPYVAYGDPQNSSRVTVKQFREKSTAIQGATTVCQNKTITLNDEVTGGTWSSGATAIAVVGGGGSVTGIASGTAVIYYTQTTGCVSTTTITVNPAPPAITGPATACPGTTVMLSDTQAGGVWSSGNTNIATVDQSGNVNTILGGSTFIYYTGANGCSARAPISVNIYGDWGLTGNTPASYNNIDAPAMAADANGTPYMVYTDNYYNGWASVRKFDGTNWVQVGNQGFSNTQAYNCSIAIGRDGTPFVVFRDANYGYALSVMKFDGNNWVYVGSRGVTLQNIYMSTIAIDANGTPYIGYQEYYYNGSGASVMKFNGSNWVYVGQQNFSNGQADNVKMTLDGNNVPYVVFSDNNYSGRATVMKFDGTNWNVIGSRGSSQGYGGSPSLALSQDNTPYVTYIDYNNNSQVGTMSFDGNNWVNLPGSTLGYASTVSMVIDALGSPNVAYTDRNDNNALKVVKYNGSGWASVGSSLSPGFVNYTNFVLAGNGTAYVSYIDAYNNNYATVKQLKATPTVIIAPATLCPAATTTLSDQLPGGTWSMISDPSIATIDAAGVLNGVTGGNAIVGYTLDGGCLITNTVVILPITPHTFLSAPGAATCAGQTVTYTTQPGQVHYIWSVPGIPDADYTVISGDTTSTSNTITLRWLTLGNRTVVVDFTNATGCAGPGPISTTTRVNPMPEARGISGNRAICSGTTTQLGDASPNGTWSSAAMSVATVDVSGLVTGVASGTAPISYTVTNSCGSAYAVANVTVTTTPGTPADISGPTTVCGGSVVGLSDASAGGVWYSSSNSIATISSTGLLTPVTSGGVTIIYVLSNACGSNVATSYITVSPALQPISGPSTVCAGTPSLLSDATLGGAWTTSNTSIATVAANGSVSGVSGGSTTVSYSFGAGCYVTASVTVSPLPVAGAITGTQFVCSSATTALTDAMSGGVWSSNNTAVATVNAVGMVSGVSSGMATISYTVTNGCGSVSALSTVTVNPVPDAGTVTGTSTLCAAAFTQLSDGIIGGVWSSNNTAVATVNSLGMISGISAGTATISYTVSNACVSSRATSVVTVNALPVAGTITGVTTVCAGFITNLTDASGGGIWSSDNTTAATVNANGAVTGVAAGTATISYTVTNGCGMARAISNVTVNASPGVAAITGTAVACATTTTRLSDVTVGGVWSSNNTAVATVNAGGVVSGLSAGTATISYTITNGCGAASAMQTVTVNPQPNAGTITGNTSISALSTTTLSDNMTGGVWSSANSAIATVNIGGTVTGAAAGNAVIAYTVTNGCGVAATTTTVTVSALTNAGTITGITTLCVSSVSQLSDAVTGGTWTSNNPGVATITTPGGMVTAVSAGTAVISYSVGAGGLATTTITVNPLAQTTGATNLCPGTTTTLVNTTAGGGTWSSSNSSVATVGLTSAIASGVSGGVATISFTTIKGCVALKTLTVTATAPVTGASSVCVGQNVMLSDAAVGGTWSSSIAGIAGVDMNTGIVTGVSAGATTISYSMAGGCSRTATMTVNALSATTGSSSMCQGATTLTLINNTAGGGTWSSSNTAVATVGLTNGVVTGVNSGSATINFTTTTGCVAAKAITIGGAGPISGAGSVCVSQTVTLSNATTGGTWSTNQGGIAGIGITSGIVTGVGAGSATISYYLSGGCVTTATITVNSLLASTGASSVCQGANTTLVNSSAGGGTWSSSNTLVATVGTTSAIAGGVSGGTVNITFTTIKGCVTTKTLTVNAMAPIAGGTSVCVGQTLALSDLVTGGTWTSSIAGIAGVGMNTGIVTGTSAGTTVISYSQAGNCIMTNTMTVNPLSAITGTTAICQGRTVTLANGTPGGGTWTSSNTTIATVGLTTAVVTGVSAGSANISFTSIKGCVATKAVTITLCRLADTTTLTSSVPVLSNVYMFPNPNKGTFTVKGTLGTTGEKEVSLTVVDMLGQVIYKRSITTIGGDIDQEVILNSSLANGMYMLEVRSESDSKVFHFVIGK